MISIYDDKICLVESIEVLDDDLTLSEFNKVLDDLTDTVNSHNNTAPEHMKNVLD